MEKLEPIWWEIPRFLDNHSVTRFARTCRTLSLIARNELRRRAQQYLRSDNTWKHSCYPVRGYFGRRFDSNGNEMDPESSSTGFYNCVQLGLRDMPSSMCYFVAGTDIVRILKSGNLSFEGPTMILAPNPYTDKRFKAHCFRTNRSLEGQEQLDLSATDKLAKCHPTNYNEAHISSCTDFATSYFVVNCSTFCHDTIPFTCHRLWVNSGL